MFDYSTGMCSAFAFRRDSIRESGDRRGYVL